MDEGKNCQRQKQERKVWKKVKEKTSSVLTLAYAAERDDVKDLIERDKSKYYNCIVHKY